MAPKAIWTPKDVDKLLEILKEEKASAGNGSNFKKATFRKAAEELEKIHEKGGPKTASVCESKWGKLRQTYNVVAALSAQSGFHWDDEHGADINEDSEAVWQAYVQAHPEAAPFRNKGWEYFERMKELMPSKAKGSYALHPAIQASGPEAITSHRQEPVQGHESDSEDGVGVPHPVTPRRGLDEAAEDGDSPASPSTPPPPSKRRSPLPVSVSSSKRPRNEQALAINGLRAELNSFNSTFRAAVVAPDVNVNSTPERKARAVDLAQEREMDLDDDEMVSLLDVFRADVTAADTYMRIKKEGVRKKWVQKQLTEASYK